MPSAIGSFGGGGKSRVTVTSMGTPLRTLGECACAKNRNVRCTVNIKLGFKTKQKQLTGGILQNKTEALCNQTS